MPKAPYGRREYTQAKARLIGEPCAHGCGRLATIPDHQPPLSFHEHVEGSGCCVLIPSCAKCSYEQGGQIARALQAGRPARVELEVEEPEGFGPRDSIWDRAPWLKSLRRVPKESTWPRLMTAPHRRVVGTYGPMFVKWAEVWTGRKLRHFQKLIAYRMLEHDAAGHLVWEQVIVTMARQVGKSYFLRCLALWRMHHGHLFGGEPQLVLHTASTLQVAREVIGPAQTWAQEQGGYRVRFANGEIEINHLVTQSRWIVRANRSLIGYTVALAICDEAWDVDEDLVTQGLEPTTAAVDDSQLLLVSTANSHPKDLIPNRRMAALGTLREPHVDLLLEWSLPRHIDVWDRKLWRMSSPFWTERRERLIERKLRDAETKGEGLEAVAAQWFCWWPPKAVPASRGVPLLDPMLWMSCLSGDDTDGPLVIGVEDWIGKGAAVAFCGQTPVGRFVIGGELCANRGDAYQLARHACGVRDGSQVVVGASLSGDPVLDDLGAPVAKAGIGETPSALATLRDMLSTGQVVQDGSPELETQALKARITATAGGNISLVPGERSDLLRAAAWALQRAVRDPVVAPAIHPARRSA